MVKSSNWNFRYFGLLSLVALYSLLLGPPVLLGVMLHIAPLSFLESVSRLWARMILWSGGIRVEYQGHENLIAPPAVLVGNHLSLFDILALIVALPRPPVFTPKKELLKVPIFGPSLKALGHIPIDRNDREKAIASIQAGTRDLEEKQQYVVFFPEGTRSVDGQLKEFKKGAFVFAIESGLPVVPFAVQGTYEINPPNTYCLYPGLIRLQMLTPIAAQNYTHEQRDQLLHEAHERIGLALSSMGETPE